MRLKMAAMYCLCVQPYFFGCYETKLSTLALSKLLSHIIATNDQHLADIFITEQNPDNTKEGENTNSSSHSNRACFV